MRNILFVLVLLISFTSCNSPETPAPAKELTPEEQTLKNIQTLKKVAASGDLVVRLTDDIISNQIRYLNDKDKSYSHCGMILEKDGQKFVCHIAPENIGADTVQYIPIDTFLNPDKNIKCALYRYNFPIAEKDSIIKVINKYKAEGIRFDRVYNLATDDKLYCSEMIAKAIKTGTNNRINFIGMTLPVRMQKVVTAYFKQEKNYKEIVPKRLYIPLDHLYLIPECKEIMSFPLKHFPGQ